MTLRLKSFLSCSVAALAIATGTPALADELAVLVVIENGGVVQDREGAMATIRATLGELVELRRRRSTRDAEITIVLSANPTEIAWSGTPDQLMEQGQAVLNIIGFVDSCSDLVLAYEQLHIVTRVSRPADSWVIGIGPFIHAGYPCGEGEAVITLPQPVPVEVRLGAIAASASLVRLLDVHPDQDAMLLDYLEAGGVMERARGGMSDVEILDPAQTRARLGNLLEER